MPLKTSLSTAALLFLIPLVLAALPARASHLRLPTQELRVSFDLEAHRLHGQALVTVQAGDQAMLHLGGLEIERITVNGTAQVPPADGVLAVNGEGGQSTVVDISYGLTADGSQPGSFNFIDPSGVTLADLWHPVADQDMLHSLTVTLPPGFSAVSEAEEVVVESAEDGGSRASFLFPYPARSINLAAGPYVVEEEPLPGGKTLASYFFPEDRELAASYRAKVRGYLELYEKLIGPYPYSRYHIVENRLPTGFAMPTMTLLGQAVVRLPFIQDTALGHEVLHSWFGNSVRSNGEGNWAEGLTSYLADHLFQETAGRGAEHRKELLVNYASYVTPEQNLSVAGFRGAHHSAAARPVRAVGYHKAAMFFHLLRRSLGEELFFKGLQDFYGRFRFQAAGWTELRRSFEGAAGRDLTALFGEWLTRADIPDLAVKKLQVNEEEGHQVVTFLVEQQNDPPYHLEIPYLLETSGIPLRGLLRLEGKTTEARIMVDGSALALSLDPDYDLMRSLAYAELPPTWSRFVGAEKKMAVLASEEERSRYLPLIELLEAEGCATVLDGDTKEADLTSHALLFLGPDGRRSRSLFARSGLPAEGFTADIRNHPLNPALAAVLVQSASQAETAAAARKLPHYGKYGYLHFEQGRVTDKRLVPTENGLRFDLDQRPAGLRTSQSGSFDTITAELLAKRVIYVGEMHTTMADHRLQLQIIRALFEKDPKLAIGMEMFPATAQKTLDDYVAGKLSEKEFLKQSGYFKVWGYDYRLYREILDFARHNQLPVVGLNIDKKIVSTVFKDGGTDTLSDEQKSILPTDRDLDMAGYRERLHGVFTMHGSAVEAGRQFAGFIQSQSIWDETMAANAVSFLEANPDHRLVVIAGNGHTDKKTAMPPRLYRRLPVEQAVVRNSSGHDLDDTADYIFFSPPVELEPPTQLGVLLDEDEETGRVTIKGLSPHGAAQQAGIKEKDVLLAMDGEPVKEVADLKIALFYKEAGSTARLRVLRGENEELEIAVELKTPPKMASPH